MCKLLRRLFLLALLGGAGYALYTAIQGRREAPDGAPPEWPPFDGAASPAPADTAPAAPSAATGVADHGSSAESVAADGDAPDEGGGGETSAQRWAEPIDGECPDGFPIKGNADSGIYHVPGGRFYDRTIPERCYADEDDAIADGYRRSKA